jgi:hypothetical protein
MSTALKTIMIPVQSSAIKAVGFDGKDMLVEFHDGKVYEYSDVPANQVCALMFSDSPGRMYQASIQGRYPSKWVNDPRKAQMIGIVEGGAQ